MKRLCRSPLALLAAICALRSAGFAFGILNIDESDYMVFGAGLMKGLLPYRDLVEIKPPLGYLTYLPAGWFGGMQVLPMRVLGVLWVFATAMLLRAAARAWMRAREPELADDIGTAAAWAYLLALLCEIPSLGGELMLNLPAAGALYALARAWSGRERRLGWILASGICAALASLYKHQGAVIALAFALAMGLRVLLPAAPDKPGNMPAGLPGEPGRAGRIREGLVGIVVLSLGFAIPWAICFAAYAALHQLPAFIEWVFTRNLQYAGKGMAGSAFARGVQSTLLCVAATIVPWALALRGNLRCARSGALWRDPFLLACTFLLWLTWLAVAAGGRFYEHYYLQFAPALALLAAPDLARLARGYDQLSKPAKAALVLGCALPVLGLTGYSWARGISGAYPGQEPRAREVAAFIQANSRPEETLFVWGHYTPIYVLSQRLPGTRYENTSVHMGNFDPAHLSETFDASRFRSERDVAATLADFENRKPDLIVDTAPADIHDWHKIPLRAFPELERYIAANYRQIGSPANAPVYRRIEGKSN